MSLCAWTARSEGAAPSAPSLLQRGPPWVQQSAHWCTLVTLAHNVAGLGSFLRTSLDEAAVRPSFLVVAARDGTCLPAHHGLLSSQRHWPHARVGIGNALVGGGLRHHHRRRRVKRLSVQSCKCARKASGCSRGAPSRSRRAACTRSRVTVQTKQHGAGRFMERPLSGFEAEAAAAKAGASTRASARSAAARARARSCGRVQRPRLFGAMRTPPRAADERRLGGRLGGRWPTRETIRPLAPSAVRGGAACAPVAAFRRVSYVAEARLESGERPVANRREQQALANCRAVHFFVSKPELGIEGGS